MPPLGSSLSIRIPLTEAPGHVSSRWTKRSRFFVSENNDDAPDIYDSPFSVDLATPTLSQGDLQLNSNPSNIVLNDGIISTSRSSSTEQLLMPSSFKANEIIYGTSHNANDKKLKTVRNFVLGDIVGRGTYGKVRESIDTDTLRRVAVKIVSQRMMKKGGADFKREIAVMKRIRKHINIVQLIDDFEECNKFYVVLEYIAGGTLQDILSQNITLDLSFIGSMFSQLVSALSHCHSCGIVHRDVKPGNLLLTSEGVLKLADFGVSEIIGSFVPADQCSLFRGSPAFQPPEVCSGDMSMSSVSGFAVDWWAAGVSLFYMVTGHLPFEATNVCDLLQQISSCKIKFPSCLDSDLLDLLQGLLQPDPSKRLTADAIRKHPFVNHQWSVVPPPKILSSSSSVVNGLWRLMRRDGESTVSMEGSPLNPSPISTHDNDSNGINIKSNNNIDSRIDSEANINNRNVDNVSTLMNSAADTESNERVGRMSPKRCFLM